MAEKTIPDHTIESTRIGRALAKIHAELAKGVFSLEQMNQDVAGLNAQQSAAIMARMKLLNEYADDIKKEIGKAYDHMRVMVVPTKMDEEGLDSFKLTGIGRVSVTPDIHASIISRDPAFEWLTENGHGDIIIETVNASTLKAILRQRLREAQDIPGDIFKVTPYDRASITKA